MTLNKYKNLSQYIFHIAVMVYVVRVSASVSLVAEWILQKFIQSKDVFVGNMKYFVGHLKE
jgi:hypothetical protein